MKTSVETTVKFSEVDSECKVSFGKMIDFLQDCSNIQSESIGVGIDYQMQTKKAWILSSWQINIKGDIFNRDEIITSTWPYMFKRGYGKRNYTISLKDSPDKNIIEADSMWVLYDMVEKRLSKVTEADTEKYICEPPLYAEWESKKIQHGEEYQKQDEYIVRKYHLDINNHMNNAWYVKIAEEYIEDKAKIKIIRVEYRKSAKLGDTIVPFVCYDGKRYLIELRAKDDSVYAVTEFIEK